MNCQIAYLSKTGNSKRLAQGVSEAFRDIMPAPIDLSVQSLSQEADTCVLCFGMAKGEPPLSVLNILESLDGKRLMCLITCGLEITEAYHQHIQKKLLPFLSETCDLLGLHLCAGAFPDEIRKDAAELLQRNPESRQARATLHNWEQASGHPNEADIHSACRFVQMQLSRL